MINELIIGGLVHHFTDVTPIENTSLRLNAVVKVNEFNILVGENSIKEPIYGFGYDVPINNFLDFKFGAYFQDSSKFLDYGYVIPTGNVMPIIGLEFDIPITDNIGITTTVTPLMSFTGLSFRF